MTIRDEDPYIEMNMKIGCCVLSFLIGVRAIPITFGQDLTFDRRDVQVCSSQNNIHRTNKLTLFQTGMLRGSCLGGFCHTFTDVCPASCSYEGYLCFCAA